MTLLGEFDRYNTFTQGVDRAQVRRAIAIAQAADEWEEEQGIGLALGMVKRRAEELLRGKP